MKKYQSTTENIKAVFQEHSLVELRQGIWEWFSYLVEGSSVDKKKRAKVKGLYHILKKLLIDSDRLFRFYQTDKDFKPIELDYVLRPAKFFPEKKGNRKTSAELVQATYLGEFQFLSYEELFDPYQFFTRFFGYLKFTDWISLLKLWKKHSLEDTCIQQVRIAKSRMTDTYILLQQFVESCYMFYRTVFCGFVGEPTPLKQFCDVDNYITHVDCDAPFRPFSYLHELNQKYTVKSLKKQLKSWFEASCEKGRIWEEGEPGDLVDFYFHVLQLVETGFLISQINYVFEDWLDTKSWYNDDEYTPMPRKQQGGYGLTDHHLSEEEYANPFLVLHNLFRNGYLADYRSSLDFRLHHALISDDEYRPDNYGLLPNLYRLIEALYLIDVQVCLKGTQFLK